jgi:hypothetical protein
MVGKDARCAADPITAERNRIRAVPFQCWILALAQSRGRMGTFPSPTLSEKETVEEALSNVEAFAVMPHRMVLPITRPRQ